MKVNELSYSQYEFFSVSAEGIARDLHAISLEQLINRLEDILMVAKDIKERYRK